MYSTPHLVVIHSPHPEVGPGGGGRNQQWHTFQPSSKPSCTLGLAIRTSQRDPTVRATYKQRAWTRRASQNGPRYFILESWPFQRWKTMSSWNRFDKMKLNHSKRENDLKLERIDEHLFAPGLRFKWLNVSKLSSGRHSCLKYKHHA